jgi:hypothetical protein
MPVRRSMLGVLVAAAVSSCANPVAEGDAASSVGRREVLAPIESADVVVRESFPPQYAVRIVSGLPSGCAAFERTAVERRDARIEISVWNTVPVGQVPCTMIYRTHDQTADLGTSFEPGATYEVRINDAVSVTFVAQ